MSPRKLALLPMRGRRTSTRPAQCRQFLPSAGGLPIRCEDRLYRAGRCAEHYADWRNEKETRGMTVNRITHAVPAGRKWKRKKPKTVFDYARLGKANAKRQRRRARNLGGAAPDPDGAP